MDKFRLPRRPRSLRCFCVRVWRNGRRIGLKPLSAQSGNLCVEPLKFGEPCEMAIPSQASPEEGVETRRAAPKAFCYGEGIVQTANASTEAAVKTVAGTKIRGANARGGSNPPARTTNISNPTIHALSRRSGHMERSRPHTCSLPRQRCFERDAKNPRHYASPNALKSLTSGSVGRFRCFAFRFSALGAPVLAPLEAMPGIRYY